MRWLACALDCVIFNAAATVDKALEALRAGNVEAARNELQAPANAGEPRALFLLGRIYLLGPPALGNRDVGLRLVAAAAGMPIAQTTLGTMYYSGEGVTKDMTQAVRYLERGKAPR